ncbi:hypothetical protein ACHAXN_004672 [Cyclotella atomus]
MKLQTALSILFTPKIHSFQPSLPPRRATSLSYYQPNLPLSSRLSEIKSELTNIQNKGLDKFLLDEISAAQKRLNNDVGNAEKVADAIVKKGRGEEGKLMRDTLRSDDEMAAVLNGLKGVRQELEEVRGVKELGGVAEETIKNDLLLESDLQSVTAKVASSLKDAEATIQSSLATLSAGDISDDNRETVLKQLGKYLSFEPDHISMGSNTMANMFTEASLTSISQSLQTSNTLAASAKKSTDESLSLLSRITQTRNDLMNAMEDTEDTIGFIAEKGGDDKSLMDIVEGMGDVAYETVKEVEAVEKLANILTTKVSKQVDTIQSLNTKTTQVVTENMQTVINAIRESKSSENTKVLTDFADKLKEQGESIKQFANALQTDINNDKTALDLVRSANVKLQAMLDAAENQVDAAKRAIVTRDKLDATYVEQNIVDVKSAILAIMDATKTSAELAADKLKSSNAKVTEKVKVEDKEETKSVTDKVADAPPAKEVVSESKAESKPAEAKTDTPEQKEEPKEDATSVKLENKATEGSEETGTTKFESKVDTKAADAKEDTQPTKSDPKTEPKIDSKKEVEEATKANNEPKSSSAEAKKEDTPEHDESKVVKNTNDAPKDTPNISPKDVKQSDQPSQTKAEEKSIDSKPENGHSESTSEGNLLPSETEHSNTPATSEKPLAGLSDSKPDVKPHIDVVTDAHAETEPSNLLSAAHLDVGDLHASASDVEHELANVVFNAAEVVQELANVVAASLFV